MQIKKVAVLTLALAFVAGFLPRLQRRTVSKKNWQKGVFILTIVPSRKQYIRMGC